MLPDEPSIVPPHCCCGGIVGGEAVGVGPNGKMSSYQFLILSIKKLNIDYEKYWTIKFWTSKFRTLNFDRKIVFSDKARKNFLQNLPCFSTSFGNFV